MATETIAQSTNITYTQPSDLIYLRKDGLLAYKSKSKIYSYNYYEAHNHSCVLYIDKTNYTEDFLKQSKIINKYKTNTHNEALEIKKSRFCKWILVDEYLLNYSETTHLTYYSSEEGLITCIPEKKKKLLEALFIPLTSISFNLIPITELYNIYDINKYLTKVKKDVKDVPIDINTNIPLTYELITTLTTKLTNSSEIQRLQLCNMFYNKVLQIGLNKTKTEGVLYQTNIQCEPFLEEKDSDKYHLWWKLFHEPYDAIYKNNYIITSITGTAIYAGKEININIYNRNMLIPHLSSLKTYFDTYGVTVPIVPKVSEPESKL